MQKRAHAVPFVNLLNILPLHQTYFKTTCSFMHDFFNDQVPPNISDLFSYSSEKHHHYTSSSAAGNLCLKYSRTNIKKNLSQDWVQGSGIVFPSVFALYLNMNLNGTYWQLLNILTREDTYVDVRTVTDKFIKLQYFSIHFFFVFCFLFFVFGMFLYCMFFFVCFCLLAYNFILVVTYNTLLAPLWFIILCFFHRSCMCMPSQSFPFCS